VLGGYYRNASSDTFKLSSHPNSSTVIAVTFVSEINPVKERQTSVLAPNLARHKNAGVPAVINKTTFNVGNIRPSGH
jgi:hypothetical protein